MVPLRVAKVGKVNTGSELRVARLLQNREAETPSE